MSSSSYYYAAIHIVLQKTGVEDDLLTIRPDNYSDNYKVTYAQNSVNATTYSMVTPGTISNYLRLFFESVAGDTDGPDFVQIDIPTFPSVCIRTDDAPYYAGTLNRQITMLQDMWDDGAVWPLETSYATPILVTPTNARRFTDVEVC